MDVQYASSRTDNYVPGALFANSDDIVADKAIIPDGHAAMEVGTVLGKITLGDASVATGVGNTGEGTLTLDAETPILTGAKAGNYHVVCIVAPGSNGGIFQVTDPDGIVIGQADILGGGGAFANQIKFVIADSGTDFAVGDEFTVTIEDVSATNQYILSLAAATDGSQVPTAILGESTPAVDDEDGLEAMIYIKGTLIGSALTLGAGHTLTSIKDGFRTLGLSIK